MEDSLEPLPNPELRDHVRTGVRAGISTVPVVGGPAQVLVDAVLIPSIDKRREAWLRKLGELVNELGRELDNWSPAKLADDDVFVSAVIEASRIAMGTHLEEKLDLLKNCLASMVTMERADAFIDLRLFHFVEVLEPEHFLVLQYLENPGAWFDARGINRPSISMGSPNALFAQAQLPVSGIALEMVLADLGDRRLADTGSLGVTMSGGGLWQGRVSELGKVLLDFVHEI